MVNTRMPHIDGEHKTIISEEQLITSVMVNTRSQTCINGETKNVPLNGEPTPIIKGGYKIRKWADSI